MSWHLERAVDKRVWFTEKDPKGQRSSLNALIIKCCFVEPTEPLSLCCQVTFSFILHQGSLPVRQRFSSQQPLTQSCHKKKKDTRVSPDTWWTDDASAVGIFQRWGLTPQEGIGLNTHECEQTHTQLLSFCLYLHTRHLLYYISSDACIVPGICRGGSRMLGW